MESRTVKLELKTLLRHSYLTVPLPVFYLLLPCKGIPIPNWLLGISITGGYNS